MSGTRVDEDSFRSWDGTELFYRAWRPVEPGRCGVVVFHGGHEHSGRFTPVVEALDLPGVAFFGWDARGHGRSPGRRGYARGFQDLVCDADAFLHAVSERHSIRPEDMALLGHSEGSVIAASLVLDHAVPVRGMVLGSPALRIKLYVPLGYPLLKAWTRLRPDSFVNSFVVPSMLTHDLDEQELRRYDPLIARPIGAKVLADLLDTGQRLVREAPRIQVPTLMLSAGSDRVVRLSAQRAFFSRLGSGDKQHLVFPGFYHEVFHERDRKLPIDSTRAFLTRLFAQRSGTTSLAANPR